MPEVPRPKPVWGAKIGDRCPCHIYRRVGSRVAVSAFHSIGREARCQTSPTLEKIPGKDALVDECPGSRH
jgi:hypothetical protein